MARHSHTILTVLTLLLSSVVVVAEQKQDESITLPPFTDTYYWHAFTVSKDTPVSEDGRYRLVKVRKSGEVELIDCAVSELKTKIVIAKPPPKTFKKGEPLPTVIVESADAKTQIANLKELCIK
jgi:hypothetical protein